MLSINATLADSMAKGEGIPITKLVHKSSASETEYDVFYYKFNPDKLTCKIIGEIIISELNSSRFFIRRGLNIQGANYTVDGPVYFIQTSTYRNSITTLECNSNFPGAKGYSLSVSTKSIEQILTDIANIQSNYVEIEFLGTPSWKDWKPLNQSAFYVSSSNSINALLRRIARARTLPRQDKLVVVSSYNILNNGLVFTQPDLVFSPTEYHKTQAIGYVYIWKDFSGAEFIYGIPSYQKTNWNMGVVDGVTAPDDFIELITGITTKYSIDQRPDLRLENGDDFYIYIPAQDEDPEYWSKRGILLLTEEFHSKEYLWNQHIDVTTFTDSTPTGISPTQQNGLIGNIPTIQELDTSRFNNILSENDSTVQSAMEILDLHTHSELSGTYTPTRSANTNLDSNPTLTEAQYMRVGNTVTVSGRFTADPTLNATTTSFEITLPIASNIGAAEDVAGVAFCGSIASMGAEIIGVAANNTAKVQWKSTDITSQTWSYTFTYQVI